MGKRTMRRRERKVPKVYLENNLYTTGALNVIVGKPGIGKSVVSMAIAKELVKSGASTNLTYIDSDSKGDSSDMSNYCLDRGYKYWDVIDLLEEEKDITTELEMTLDLLINDTEKGEVVVIDALINLMEDVTGNTEAGDIMTKFRSICKDKNLTIIVIHHTRKEDNTYLGATAIASNVEAIHLVTDQGTRQRPNKLLEVAKDNTGQLGHSFSLDFEIMAGVANTFNIDVRFKPIEADPYEGMSKVERRQAIKSNYLLKYAVAYTSRKEYKPLAVTVLKDIITKNINKSGINTTKTPTAEDYIGATFIAKTLPGLVCSHFDVDIVKEGKATIKNVLPITTQELTRLNLGELPKVYTICTDNETVSIKK